jgi:hypothetical protein
MDTEMKDIIGTPFSVGHMVATDVAFRRSSRLRVGLVEERREVRPGRVEVRVNYALEDGRRNSVWRTPAGVVKVAF